MVLSILWRLHRSVTYTSRPRDVVEPDLEYSCSVSVTHANSLDSFTATFSDDGTQFTISAIGE
ncbi:hypothetical protein E2C01_065771 [Portunus trituberculatus]|uniref:Uncharacterized protein n=1 Tax=Portunus trituberculatus TaxID=210409 RepID=A0A5B7HMZ6_PORTR|nr:hypothetical protein [Portunus trituberculatus]